jgi:hypothetical protein
MDVTRGNYYLRRATSDERRPNAGSPHQPSEVAVEGGAAAGADAPEHLGPAVRQLVMISTTGGRQTHRLR